MRIGEGGSAFGDCDCDPLAGTARRTPRFAPAIRLGSDATTQKRLGPKARGAVVLSNRTATPHDGAGGRDYHVRFGPLSMWNRPPP
ncbi:MAG: hypothetical protein AAFR55_07565 [Pseudomonadota bacterium]